MGCLHRRRVSQRPMSNWNTYRRRGGAGTAPATAPVPVLLYENPEPATGFVQNTLNGDARASVWTPPAAGFITAISFWARVTQANPGTGHYELWTGETIPALQLVASESINHGAWSTSYEWHEVEITPTPFAAGLKLWAAMEKDTGNTLPKQTIGYTLGAAVSPHKLASQFGSDTWIGGSTLTTFCMRLTGYYT